MVTGRTRLTTNRTPPAALSADWRESRTAETTAEARTGMAIDQPSIQRAGTRRLR